MSKVSRDPSYRQAVQDFIAEFKYGDLVTHEWLEERFGMPTLSDSSRLTNDQFKKRQFEWLASVESFKAELLEEHQICLQSVRGKGYQWLYPCDQTAAAVKEFQRGVKKMFSTTGAKLRNIRVLELTDEQRRENLDTVAKFSALQGMEKRVLK